MQVMYSVRPKKYRALKNNIIIIRLFGSDDCEKCDKLKRAFDMHSISYKWIDAMADETQKLCDKHGVDELPHIQAYEEEDKVFYNRIGFTSPLVIMQEIIEAKEALNDPPHKMMQGVRRRPMGPKLPKKANKGCNGCNDKNKSKS